MAIPKKMLKLLIGYRVTFADWNWEADQGSFESEREYKELYYKAEDDLMKYLKGYCRRAKSPRKVKPVPTFDDGV